LVQTKEERKAKIKEYYQTEQGKATRKRAEKKYKSSEHGKAKIKEYRSSEKGRAIIKEYEQTEKGKATIQRASKKYKSSKAGKAKIKEYTASKAGKASEKKFQSSEKGGKSMQLKVLKHFSKLHSNSYIPCCACCGENSHLDFLAIDHIIGRAEMNSIKELVEIGYKSVLISSGLNKWIIDNNYLSDLKTEYFQILCHNCNTSKGYPRNNNECIHKKNTPH